MSGNIYILRLTSIVFSILFFGILSYGQEICDNGIDDDGDGLIDCWDPECDGHVSCWDCATNFFQVHSNTTLVSLDPATGAYNTIATISGATDINGLQQNPIDLHVYAPIRVNGTYSIGMLNNDGSVVDLNVALPQGGIFFAGAIDANGTMFISRGGDGVYSIDLTTTPLVANPTGVSHPGVADLALDLNNGLFYGINGSAQLKVFDPVTNFVSTYDLAGSINNDSGAFGAAWSSSDGSFFAYNNSSGKIYTIDVNTLAATEVLNGTGNLSINDGFNCVLAPPPFEGNCGDGIDDDGDGLVDCNDPDCANSNVCIVEICNNGIDDDGDGWTDCSDTECFALSYCVEICDNGIDDNGNGLVDDDDPQCVTPPGVQAGLESNRRLSSKVAYRNFFNTVNNPESIQMKKEGLIPFEANATRDLYNLEGLIPNYLLGYEATESTPENLVEITNATQMAAADYYKDDRRIGSVLGIVSKDGVYEHTKYICDRLEGLRLIDLSFTYAKGGNFLSYELLSDEGQAQYATGFSAFLKDGEFHIENHWNLHKYTKNQDMYNFQIWGKTYFEMIQLLEDVLARLEERAPIHSIKYSALPKVFITHGSYENGLLTLAVKNKDQSNEVSISANYTRAEGDDPNELSETVNLSGARDEIIEIETGYLYDLSLSLNSNGVSDEIFIADGAWGIDESDDSNVINHFTVLAHTNESDESSRAIERSIELKASVNDYLNIYRTIDAKATAHNFDQFEALSFTASGDAQISVTLVKESILDWEDQFRMDIMLNEEERDFILKKEFFKSMTYEIMDFSDITMMVFTVIGNNDKGVKSISIENVRFETPQYDNNGSDDLADYQISITPNPASEFLVVDFLAKENIENQINILNAQGQMVSSTDFFSLEGLNSKQLDIRQLSAGLYYFQITNTKGLVASGSFVKAMK